MNILPPTKFKGQWKITMCNIGDTSSNGSFSIVMLLFQVVKLFRLQEWF